MRLTRSIVCVFATIAATVGCSNFEHPLPWERSPLHEELPGSWQAVDDSEPPMPIEVIKHESGSLLVDMSVNVDEDSGDSDSSPTSGSRVDRVSFQGDVLAFNDVHVLQIDMSTYKERKKDSAKRNSTGREGYRFLRVVSDGNSMVFRPIDIKQFARYAESQLYSEGTTLTAPEFASCVDRRIREEIASGTLDALLKERRTNWLSEDELSELKQVRKEFENRAVEPYGELQQMRECIAFKLSGDELGRLFSSAPDASFSGETLQLMRVK